MEDDPASSKGAGARVLWQGTAFALREGENLLGRDPDGSVFVDDASVSRRHARVTVTAEGARLAAPRPLRSLLLGVFDLAPEPADPPAQVLVLDGRVFGDQLRHLRPMSGLGHG